MKRSLLYHGKLRQGLRNDPMTIRQEQFVIPTAVEMIDGWWEIPDDFMSFQHYLRVVLGKIKWTSSPGYPYMLRFPDNRCFFSVVDGQPSWERVLDVWNQVQMRLRDREADPIYLFVKPEPHKLSKAHRKRLISGVAIIDQIIDHMLFDDFNDGLVAKAWLGPVKVGWTPYLGGWKTFPREGVSMDRSSWDWTMQPWLFRALYDIRDHSCLTDGPRRELWRDLAAWRYRSLFENPVYVCPDGEKFRQREGGVMKSGSVLTITDNSVAQIVLHLRVISEIHSPLEWDDKVGWIWALGDDTRQSVPDDIRAYATKLREFCIIKECSRAPEFAGYRFLQAGRCEPLYKGKHAFNLMHASPRVQEDLAVAYSLLYHRSVDSGNVKKILRNFGRIPDDLFLDLIFDGD